MALLAAAVTWLASVAATVVLVGPFDLLATQDLVLFSAVASGLPAIVAVATVGTWAGGDQRGQGMDGLAAAALGTLGYLALGAVLLAPGGGLALALAALFGGVAGAGIGAGIALLLLRRR